MPQAADHPATDHGAPAVLSPFPRKHFAKNYEIRAPFSYIPKSSETHCKKLQGRIAERLRSPY